MNRKILVTGGAGFIGSHFVDRCCNEGFPPIVIDDLSFGKLANINPSAVFVKCDIRDYAQMKKIISEHEIEAIFHFAASATTKETAMGWNDPHYDFEVNSVGTLNILKIIAEVNPGIHFVYTSTAAVYGEPEYVPIDEKHPTNPVSPYGISKLAGEKYCFAYHKEWDVPITIMRVFNTFGPRQPRYVMYDLMKKIYINSEQLEVLGTGKQLRDYAYISDTVEAFYNIWRNPESIGKIYNVAGGNRISIDELVPIITEVMQVKPRIIYTGTSWKGDISRLWASVDKIKSELGWEPKTSLKQGIESIYEWFKSNTK